MINKETIYKTLSDLGLSSNDIVMIHGDAGPAAQIVSTDGENKLTEFIRILVSYFSSGTILVPSFSYSFTKNEPFDPLLTKSEVGLFSESFRNYTNIARTSHPIFSFSIYGKDKQKFIDASLTDCFIFFDRLIFSLPVFSSIKLMNVLIKINVSYPTAPNLARNLEYCMVTSNTSPWKIHAFLPSSSSTSLLQSFNDPKSKSANFLSISS